ncbi:uncharacterized protein M6B38_180695 [Iris pallida]|uniref:EF-hand domain-containing protein n=1 Tax=Iris pallida TaxID=29817 RepID=A0AAX6EN45_IRIPA|nr:uncharacterized protein M6B38_180695 [Iris pallida]
MGVIIVDGSTVRSFVEDSAAFDKAVSERFASLDLNGDGVLSRAELRRALETYRLLESHFGAEVVALPADLARLYDSIFEQFDVDRSGTVDLPEFRSEMRRMLLAIADGLGSVPIQMAIDDDGDGGTSFLQKAADLEAAKISKAATTTHE